MSPDALTDLERAEEVVRELSTEVARALRDEHIDSKIALLADEAVRLLRRSLEHLASVLAVSPSRFPVCADEPAFRAANRQLRLTGLGLALLRAQQPFVSSDNLWLARIVELNCDRVRVKSKKVANGPQVTVRKADGGEVTYNASVKFGPGVNVCGAQIDPETQLPVPTPGVTVEVRRWGALVFADGGENLVTFLSAAVLKVRALIGELRIVR
jgi:hypothetical protein